MKWDELTLVDENTFNLGRKERSFLLKGQSLSPYQVFLILKNQYGIPEYKQEEWKIQWMYFLEHKDAFFEIYDWKLYSWSIGVYLKNENDDKAAGLLALELSSSFEKASSKYNSVIKSKKQSPDEYLIQNPFVIYRESADTILKILQGNKTYLDDKDLCKSAFLLYLSSVEGFMNLIYELYLRKELREERIYERISREQIDLKIKLALVYCDCFKNKVLDSESDVFKRFHSLANLRNDFVHANFTNSMMNPVVYEDEYEFVLYNDSDTPIGIPNNFSDFEIQHIELTRDITSNLITWIISSMTDIYQREFEELLDQEYIKIGL